MVGSEVGVRVGAGGYVYEMRIVRSGRGGCSR